ncbi:exodeoxyribonuclease V subunit gamma [Francisella philomiragia]|uniref:RecBCD enzyme subunit RecC n=1 Tax=Francisella philomiragia subsp. philomiragia (strain ATCC 25017 / CCUG 19701 / FSC 153 / O\|nr:exodeoxyribonuclease V subunit gamma [Francisella philomiragia]AJI47672.1 exodeoxyribonuclease V, gamma subunit [Francisella philomiragia]AJI49170.1 exodeoxyribonuclease V, gamma subunit [Francisella philomiragia]MBK2020556.1 exodeoxyribonuclease V subunit gamma [Francisella philomiragia]MBK2030326.1 exodeoxyribonuclease V subunit gamma [Francisella philomiragia]MBK2263816.1 exodeoxyribonuclease V subunit gamma [Francisella philomiragia]
MALYTYPSNKLEYLVQVLSKLLDVEKKDFFTPTQLIVGSRGMQHWLSMQLAQYRNIAMNLKYDMINGYILDICYELTAKQEYKKAYTKDILAWRIFRSLDSINNPKLQEYYHNSDLKKYQLSVKIAQVFTMYIMYRAEWLQKWEQGEYINPAKPENDEDWQMQLWQALVKEVQDTPYKVQAEALQKLNQQNLEKLNIPKDIYIFGVNTISPKNLSFVFELAKYIDVNILYINPCSEYWYDLHKSKISAWLDSNDYELQPLLANLGQQGKEFFNQLLENQEKQELEVFEKFDKNSLDFEKLADNNQTQLVSLQRNLLELDCQNHAKQKDLSISINSCHSPLREVQILHDKLLDMIKADPSIKPRDILVMCPNIEDYSPYIDSVFSRFSTDKKLPCSIADRTLLDSEPLAASFIELLQLPESNFEVNKILDYLSVPAIQQKFKITDEQLETIRYWLKESCIHHSNNGQTFSWSWGLKRLMFGFSYSDSNHIVDLKLPRQSATATPSYQRGISINYQELDQLMTIPVIEGSEIAELGGLYELLELLEKYSQELLKPRSLEAWQDYLLEMFDDVFNVTNDEQYIAKKIKDIIVKTVTTAKDVLLTEEIDLYTIRYCLISQLSEPIINNHFLNGKVTFCSMTPMRNVPFRVIAMLGLNNGKFPRQESAISFDLMARLGRVKGDRTKRDDDRYLFLETITSARDYLYLSYIGRSVKTNVEQQPSLILKELISYLQKNYSWHTLDNVIKDNKLPKSERKNIISDIKEYPLHPFSSKCYADEYRSYDEAWLKLLQSEPKVFYDSKLLSNSVNLPKSLSISKLVKIFEDPIKAYTNYGLELYLEDDFEELEDSEPFDINSLDKHKFKQDLLNTLENNKDKELTIKTAKLSGKLPESVLTENEINKEVESIQKLLDKANLANYESKYFHQEILGYELEANCHIKDNQVLLYTSSTFGIKHRFELYLTALLVALSEQQDISATYVYFDKDKNQADTNTFAISHLGAKQLLEKYLSNAEKIVSKPSLVHLDLAKAIMEYVKENQKKDASLVEKTTKQKQQAWENVIKSSETNYKALENNSYFKLFYSEHPKIEDFEGQQIYQDFFEVINENK